MEIKAQKIEYKTLEEKFEDENNIKVEHDLLGTASRNMPGMHRISQHVIKDYKELPQLYTDACNELRIWVGV